MDVFAHLLVNGTQSAEWQYIRDVEWGNYRESGFPPGSEFGKTEPQIPKLNENYEVNLRCGRGAEKAANRTQTAVIVAGTEVGFRIAALQDQGGFANIGHMGPANVYMSKTDDLVNDVGDGDWFKISYQGPLDDKTWSVSGHTEVNFTIPLTTPPGTYLLRMEQVMPTDELGYTQWYVNCAHVDIVGNGGGIPGPSIKVPEAFHAEDPGLWLQGFTLWKGPLSKYVPTGPAVWTG